jgi:hypothetical protein
MDIWTLYNPNPPKCALTCLGDLAADWLLISRVIDININNNQAAPAQHTRARHKRQALCVCVVCCVLHKNRNAQVQAMKPCHFNLSLSLGFQILVCCLLQRDAILDFGATLALALTRRKKT